MELPPRGSIQSGILEEVIHRERIRLWKSQEIKLNEELLRLAATEETYTELTNLRATLMSMALHLPGAYDVKERPKQEVEVKKSDKDYLDLLDNLPDFNG